MTTKLFEDAREFSDAALSVLFPSRKRGSINRNVHKLSEGKCPLHILLDVFHHNDEATRAKSAHALHKGFLALSRKRRRFVFARGLLSFRWLTGVWQRSSR
jgi:hypothetical protein